MTETHFVRHGDAANFTVYAPYIVWVEDNRTLQRESDGSPDGIYDCIKTIKTGRPGRLNCYSIKIGYISDN